MSRHKFAYFAREGAYNMFSHGFMSFAAIGITVACLLIMGTFTLVAVNANAMLEDMESTNQMLAFVDESLTEEEARALMERTDGQRASYYNYYSSRTWGEAATYHLCVNSSVLGDEGTADFILEFAARKLHEQF